MQNNYSVHAFYFCDALDDFVPFLQFKKREKHTWRSVTFKPAPLLKVTFFRGCFSCFLNCTNGTKSRKASHLEFSLTTTNFCDFAIFYLTYAYPTPTLKINILGHDLGTCQ